MRRRLRKVIGWGMLLLVAVVVGGGWFAYSYVTDSETLRAAIRDGAPRFLPGSHRRRPAGAGPAVRGEGDRHSALGPRGSRTRGSRCSSAARPGCRSRTTPGRCSTAGSTSRRSSSRSRGCGSAAARTARGTSSACSPTPGRCPLGDLAAGPDRERDGRAGRRGRRARRRPGGDPPRRLGEDHAGRPQGDADQVRGLGRGATSSSASRSPARSTAQSGRLDARGRPGRRLAISNALGERLPAQARPAFAKLGLIGGEADVTLRSLVFEPGRVPRSDTTRRPRIRSGVWKCDKLPFAAQRAGGHDQGPDGVATIERAEGRNGTTTVHASGTVGLADPATAPFRLAIGVDDLELDDRAEGLVDQDLRQGRPRRLATTSGRAAGSTSTPRSAGGRGAGRSTGSPPSAAATSQSSTRSSATRSSTSAASSSAGRTGSRSTPPPSSAAGR